MLLDLRGADIRIKHDKEHRKDYPGPPGFCYLCKADIEKAGFDSLATYQIIRKDDGQVGILCLPCNMTSWHPDDVVNRYCGNCHEFHDQKYRNAILKKEEDRKKSF